MVYHFLILSDDVDNFVREIAIDSKATFLDLQKAILDSVSFKNHNEMTSFFLCTDDWEKKQEITLMDMGNNTEEDTYIMDDTRLYELIDEEKQKLLFVFDYLTDRVFFMELLEMIPNKSLKKAECVRSKGNPPKQNVQFAEIETKNKPVFDLDEDFYGDEDYDPSELGDDFEGLDLSDDGGFNDRF